MSTPGRGRSYNILGGEMKTASMSECKDPQNRSKRKDCICGSHSANDRKKNKHHHSTKKKLEIRKTRQLSNSSKNNLPKRGDTIYVDSSCSISHGSTDVMGGLATVTEVERLKGTKDTFVSVKEHPGKGYNWKFLAERQAELKKEFGQKIAHPSPDIDTPWIEDGDIVDGHVYHGDPQW
jgi:hypothetical protein